MMLWNRTLGRTEEGTKYLFLYFLPSMDPNKNQDTLGFWGCFHKAVYYFVKHRRREIRLKCPASSDDG
jgi:hypothetical protein